MGATIILAGCSVAFVILWAIIFYALRKQKQNKTGE